MPNKTNPLAATAILSVAVGLFLLLSGVQTLLEFNEPLARAARNVGAFFGNKQTEAVLSVVFAILKIVSGAVLLVGPFGLLTPGLRKLAFWGVVGFWAIVTLWSAFLAGPVFKPTPLLWIQALSLNVAILAALWQLKPTDR